MLELSFKKIRNTFREWHIKISSEMKNSALIHIIFNRELISNEGMESDSDMTREDIILKINYRFSIRYIEYLTSKTSGMALFKTMITTDILKGELGCL